MWMIEVLDSSLQPSQSIPLPPGTHDVGRELLGLVDKRLSRKQLQLTLPPEGRVSMLKVTGANPSILQSAAGAYQVLTKSTPAVRVGPADVIWLGRVQGSSELKHPIRVVVAPSSTPAAPRLMDLPEELLCLTLLNAITRSPWPGGWAMFRLVSRHAHGIFLDVARDLPRSLGWLLRRSEGRTPATLTAVFSWREPERWGARWVPVRMQLQPSLACVWEGRLFEADLSGVGLEDDGMLRLVTGLRTQPHTRLLNIGYNGFTSAGFKALTNDLMHERLMPKLELLLMREICRHPHNEEWHAVDVCGGDYLSHYTDAVRAASDKEDSDWEDAIETFERSETCKALKLWDCGYD